VQVTSRIVYDTSQLKGLFGSACCGAGAGPGCGGLGGSGGRNIWSARFEGVKPQPASVTPEVTIEPATKGDLPAVEALLTEAGASRGCCPASCGLPGGPPSRESRRMHRHGGPGRRRSVSVAGGQPAYRGAGVADGSTKRSSRKHVARVSSESTYSPLRLRPWRNPGASAGSTETKSLRRSGRRPNFREAAAPQRSPCGRISEAALRRPVPVLESDSSVRSGLMSDARRECVVSGERSMPDSEHNFGRLYTEYQPRVRRYLARIVGEHDAEDLTQTVFLKVSQALKISGETLTCRPGSIELPPILRRTGGAAFLQAGNRVGASGDPSRWGTGGARDGRTRQAALADQALVRREMNQCIRQVVDGCRHISETRSP